MNESNKYTGLGLPLPGFGSSRELATESVMTRGIDMGISDLKGRESMNVYKNDTARKMILETYDKILPLWNVD